MDNREITQTANHIVSLTRAMGGGTFDRESGRPIFFENGYVVGGLVESLVYPLSERQSRVIVDLAQFIQQHDVPLIGTWVENGQVFVDAVEHIEDQDQAIQKGVEREQQAIWDVANNEEIYIL